ncbi:MAG: polysaccharide biosynthesis/export family protein, partial [Kangiellaceae bacterium]|nr:polysaccharide biosynthesis/export family protein [Kangiellaceae bacterium]
MSSKFSNLIYSLCLGSSLLVMHSGAKAAEVDTSQLEKQCQNITQQQRQMAKAAGYDVDAACKSLKSSKGAASSVQEDNRVTVLPRGTQLETSERGVIGELEQNSLNNEEEQTKVKPQTNHYTSEQLKRYGYDLFAGVPTTFAPATDIPIPVDYIVGPGDSIQIQLLGKTSDNYQLSVERDGAINFPELGPISVTGLKFYEAKELIQ